MTSCINLRDNSWQTEFLSAEVLQKLLLISGKSLEELLKAEPGLMCLSAGTAFDAKQQLIAASVSTVNDEGCIVKLQTGNLAGFVEVDGVQLSITSRFCQSSKLSQDHLLLNLLLGAENSMADFSDFSADCDEFSFAAMISFPRVLNAALLQGIYRLPRWHEYNEERIRGSIDLPRHLRLNVPFTGRVASRSREFDFDNKVTELVRHAVELMEQHPFGSVVLKSSRRIISAVRELKDLTPGYNKNARPRIMAENVLPINHPFYTAWEELRRLSLIILGGSGFAYRQQQEQKIRGIVFDLARLYEDWLAGILCEKFGLIHADNFRKTGRITLAKGALVRYPDFYREAQPAVDGAAGVSSVVLDAKYKYLPDGTPDGDDVHQMIAYMFALKAQDSVLLYASARSGGQEDPSAAKGARKLELNGYPGNLRCYNLAWNTMDFSSFKACRESLQRSREELINYCRTELGL